MRLVEIVNPFQEPAYDVLASGYWLRETLRYRCADGSGGMVPSGFVFDGYTIPVLRKLVTGTCLSIIPAAIHDYEYYFGIPFFVANLNLATALRLTGESENTAIIGFLVSTLFGYPAYRKRQDSLIKRFAATREQAEELARIL
jgi:hypothetical protein